MEIVTNHIWIKDSPYCDDFMRRYEWDSQDQLFEIIANEIDSERTPVSEAQLNMLARECSSGEVYGFHVGFRKACEMNAVMEKK